MPVSTFAGLQTSLRGLIAQQEALDTTSHNIANASTKGYSRQEVLLSASRALSIVTGSTEAGTQNAQLGTGVDVDGITRARDRFLDLQYRAQAMRLGGLATRVRGLETIEGALAEPGETGISQELQTFWSNWEGLSNNPEDTASRQAVIEAGKALATSLAELDGQLTGAAEVAEAEFAAGAGEGGEVEQMAKEIALLNGAIRSATTSGSEPNDLLDRRDLLLDELSEMGQVSVTDSDGDGAIDVAFGDAALPLVDGTGTINWPQTLTAPGGKLGGLLDLQSRIQSYRTDLDAVASSLITSVNAAYGATVFNGSSASTISVAVTTGTIVAGSSGLAGDNGLATAVAALRNGAIDTGYAALVRRIGAESADATRAQSTQDTVVTTLAERRANVSGVSMDEEMTNMVRFQRGYQAAARVMSTLDDMLETLINRTGRVGL